MKKLSLDLQDRRVRLIELLLGVHEESLINALEKVMDVFREQEDGPKLTQAQLESRLAEAMEDVEKGRVMDGTDFLSEVQNWK